MGAASLANETVKSRQGELRRVKFIGLIAFELQLVALLAWSALEASRAVQSSDFVGFYQSWYLIAHGVLNPNHWWQQQGIFIQWPLATLALIWPHPITLLSVQDVAIVGAEVVAYFWICDIVAERADVSLRVYSLTGLALLVLDPWIYWTASWDYHSEPLGTLFAILAARDLFRGRRIAWLWCLLTLLCGMVPATYLIGIGVCLLVKRRRRVVGSAVVFTGALWFLALMRLGAGKTIGYASTSQLESQNASFARVGSLSARLTTLVQTVGHHWGDVWANLAPTGILGVFTAPGVGVAGLVLGENFSEGNPNSVVPSFQGLPLYVFIPVGTITALIWISGRFGRRRAPMLAALLVANAIGWSVVWTPKVVPTWLSVGATDASAVKQVEAIIPQPDGVVASQGIAGDFANHPVDKSFWGAPAALSMSPPYTWFVVAPYAGIETATVQQSADLIETLARDPNAQLEYEKDDVWAFRVRVKHLAHESLIVKGDIPQLSAALFTSSGTKVVHGNIRSWYLEGSDRDNGPVLGGDDFLEPPGRYSARVSITGNGPVTVQVWNETTNRLISSVKAVVRGSADLVLPAAVTRADPRFAAVAQGGSALFRIDPVPAFSGNYLELVVHSTSKAVLKVRSVAIQALNR